MSLLKEHNTNYVAYLIHAENTVHSFIQFHPTFAFENLLFESCDKESSGIFQNAQLNWAESDILIRFLCFQNLMKVPYLGKLALPHWPFHLELQFVVL